MTEKQKQTLILFAKNYNIHTIANRQKVAVTTIRDRLKRIRNIHPIEYDNACSIRNAYQRLRDGLRNIGRYGRYGGEDEPHTDRIADKF